MASTDTISDMLTRIRNACAVRHSTTQVPTTKMTLSIAKVLKSEGFIEDYSETGEGINKMLVLTLKYKGKTRQPLINTLQRVSKPGLRVYSPSKKIPRVLGGIGIAIVSTSHGIMTDREARRQGIGGEILCYIW
ncbi:30S ribosomal protein S8 [Synechocystis sp. PCC 6803]|jgi:small subunit ribosomal protein S8|uniref:Small ribosomal subunit protein uS8 n=1 Tax=Synechocystis sp. (strain ATCC 27184 / PCC 6803 / Kazusa) TaxID=1111708 RepID=RS8_SYNY3|nr:MULTISPECIES: 30S ribosomal protein S8 [unclassified Synechocystis]P73307.1 RecName: Full=Small ribosomal subunit protein uS8; AltName: Full=30S ribosomal protein S8 [Synechocystis sp. PCC 6803 substr. Kazusa]WLT37538.1 30S ribosomal protein S8 [Synechocystis sp. B12]BAM51060.1 30S ribosomal protein S8 [Synechocystis sp. PCC 6803] [Bacillus subtilis BEST7613]AGF51025.1 30S ribosomal protein S8 [Synechocystis sp. PCC 6803]ALJ67063.1 30S ribosomal protein S8 [Synechocystis sp. PCC 6803]AVP88